VIIGTFAEEYSSGHVEVCCFIGFRIFVSLLFSIPIGMIMWKSIISVVTVNLGNQ
jgi:hypothetical protein